MGAAQADRGRQERPLGRRGQGQPSHTGALLAASDVTVDALFRQAGVIRTDTLHELFDVASLLANQPRPRGRRVGIVTNAAGRDPLRRRLHRRGLEVAERRRGAGPAGRGLPAAAWSATR